MRPDDPRHGTDRGHNAHMRAGVPPCLPCIAAHTRMNKLRKIYPEKFRKVPSLGARRRIQALQAIGYGRDVIAAELGYADGGSIAYIMSPKSQTVTQGVDRRIREVYARLCMKPPTGVGAKRARTWAKRHGYAPPLAWDDIDDPNAEPQGVNYEPPTRAEVLADLVEQGAGVTEACRRLNVTRTGLQKWCGYHDLRHLYRALAAREALSTNQYTKEDAA